MNKGKALVTEGKTLVASVDKPLQKFSALRAKKISQVLGLGKEDLGEQREGLGDQKGMPW